MNEMMTERSYLTIMILVFCAVAAFAAQASGPAIGKGENITAGMTGNAVYFGRYQQDDIGTTLPAGTTGVDWISADYENSDLNSAKMGERYCAIKPIQWRVLSNANGKLFLLSEKNLDAKPYHSSAVSITWENSKIREWLNGLNGTESECFLYGAFTPQERLVIADTLVTNDDNPTYRTPGGNDTKDKIFFLSITEATDAGYGFASDMDNHNSRRSPNTAYAERINYMYASNDFDTWWLRLPGIIGSGAARVGIGGYVIDDGVSVEYPAVGVRAAFNLNLSSLTFTSAATGGKSNLLNPPSLTTNAIPKAADDLKLTVLDPSQTLEVAATAEQSERSVNLPGNLTFGYANAPTGANQYVSCVLEDSRGRITHYGKLADSSSAASGPLSVPLPAVLTDGVYTLNIFSEQANGDYCTDYAGNPTLTHCTVTLKRQGNHVTQNPSLTNRSRGNLLDVLPTAFEHFCPAKRVPGQTLCRFQPIQDFSAVRRGIPARYLRRGCIACTSRRTFPYRESRP
jgi:hypothetical protein